MTTKKKAPKKAPRFPVPEVPTKTAQGGVLAARLKDEATKLSLIRDEMRSIAEEAEALAENAQESLDLIESAAETLSQYL